MGMTYGTIAGILLTDLIMGRDSVWAALYDPSRQPVRAAGAFVRESLNVVAQYADWMTGGDVETEHDIGKIVERSSGRDSRRSRPIGTRKESFTHVPPSARISVALWPGTIPKRHGIAPATALASTNLEKSPTGQLRTT